MSGTDSKATDLGRRASMRTSMRLSRGEGDDEDYDLLAIEISDGFRPTQVAQNHANPSTTSHTDPPAAERSLARPSSIAKPSHGLHDSFSLRHDGATRAVDESGPARASIASGASQLVRPESPYQGPSGPSFPYQMYPQNVRLARTASSASATTVAITERSYDGPRGPTHPYQMYPQNTVPEAEGPEDQTAPAPPITVGFPGSTDHYQRRVGPEGEEVGDMIGPDGHTEQLPPYTRYPEEAYARKAEGIELPAVAAAAAVAPTTRATSRLQAIPGAGGIGLATRNPEFASTEDLNAANSPHSPQSRQSLRSFHTGASQHEINTAAADVSEKKPPLKKWQVVAKRKVWGVVPCWALGLTALILVMLAVVLGAILGTFLNRPKHGSHDDSSSSTTITYDATPLATVPAGLTPLATGTFAMPLMLTRDPKICFNDTTQAQSWNCNIVYSQLSMTVRSIPGQPETAQYALSVTYNDTYTMDKFVYTYGMQPPSFRDVQLILVNDTYEPTRGPAWAFEMAYNKTVIIPEALFTSAATESSSSSTDSSKLRRSISDYGDFMRKGVAQPGEKPWICHWDGTILETFIYAAQNSSRDPIVSELSSSVTGSVPTATPFVSLPSGYTGSWPPFTGRKQVVTSTAAPTSQTSTSTTPSSSSSTNYFDSPNAMPSDYQSAYPRVIKVEERRVAGSPSVQPWCRQYQVLEDGQEAQPLLDALGQFVDVMIAEDEPSFGLSDKRSVRRSLIERYLGQPVQERNVGSDMSDCGCMWWAT